MIITSLSSITRWALGVFIFQMSHGYLPFRAETQAMMYEDIILGRKRYEVRGTITASPDHCTVQQVPPVEDVGGKPPGGPASPEVQGRRGEGSSLVPKYQLEFSLPEKIPSSQSGLERKWANWRRRLFLATISSFQFQLQWRNYRGWIWRFLKDFLLSLM